MKPIPRAALILALPGAVLAATPAASPPAPTSLLEVRKASGFVMPDYAFALECHIASDLTTRRYTIGTADLLHSETVPTRYTALLNTAEAVRKLVRGAAKGDLLVGPGPVDVGNRFYTGILEGKVVDLHVKLSRYDGGGGRITRNTAPGIAALEGFAEANCPAPTQNRTP